MSPSATGLLSAGSLILALSMASVTEPAAAAPTMTEMVAMRDGARLVTDVYLPADNRSGSYPVILIRSPYPREGSQEVTKLGYALVYQSTRGRFGSEGKDIIFLDDGWGRNQDGFDTVQWIAGQSWCNGKIGTMGASAPAITQYRLVGSNPPALDCIAPIFGGADMYHNLMFQGGAFRKEIMDPWIEACQFCPEMLRNIHDHPAFDGYWREYDLATRYGKTNVPGLHIAGWYDILLQGNIDAFMGMQNSGGEGARGKQKLIIGPYSHGAFNKVGEFDFPRALERTPWTDQMNWLNHCLKGEPNETSRLKAVTYYVMGAVGEDGAPGNLWRSSDVWPVAARKTPFYLHADGSLSRRKPQELESSKTFRYDPKDPCPTVGGQNLVTPAGPYDQRKTEGRPDVLTFTTDLLTEPMEVTGRVRVKLWASSSAKDTDFTAKITDVYPDGRSMLVCDGILRARYRRSFSKPELLEPGRAYEFEIDLWSTSIIFNKGHRIRLAISSSNSPRFDANPNTGEPVFKATHNEIARNTVYFDKSRPSAAVLPVVKPESPGTR